MKKSFIITVVPLLLIVAVAITAIIIMYSRKEDSRSMKPKPAGEQSQQEALLQTVSVTLFFHDPAEECLIPEKRNIYATNLVSDRAKQIIIELMRGAAHGGVSTVPDDVSLRELYILEDGTTYVDFSREFESNAEGGSSSQLMQNYSVVNSLTYNFQEIKKVAIMIEGIQKESFGGHIYTGGFFQEKLSIVKFPESKFPSEEEIETLQIAQSPRSEIDHGLI